MRKASFNLGVMAAIAAVFAPSSALANGFEFPSNGPEQFARGSAWLARATDPLAVFFNPAALSRNGTDVSLSSNINIQKNCFDRRYPNPGAKDNFVEVASQTYGQVCNDVKPFINPQAAFSWRVTDKLGVGVAILGPSAVGDIDYPITSQNTDVSAAQAGKKVQGPSASRYILTSQSSLVLWPTIGFGYEIAPNLRIGAAFIPGIASIKFGNVSLGLNANQKLSSGSKRLQEDPGNDVNAEVSVKDYFVPGFVASAMYTVGSNIDVSGWFHWSDSIKASGDAKITAWIFDSQGRPAAQQETVNTPKNQTKVTVPQPWDARIGVRYYQLREGVSAKKLRKDPLRDEVFDIELDVQYSHDSSFDTLGIRFTGAPTAVPNPGSNSLADVPANADVPHNWKNSVGFRLGGDYNVMPGLLAIRAGGFFQTSSVDAKDLHLDFVPAQRIGATVGGTVRLANIDVQVGYGHIFFKDLNNNGNGNLRGLSGQADSTPANRTNFPVNGGKLTARADIITVGAVARFLATRPMKGRSGSVCCVLNWHCAPC